MGALLYDWSQPTKTITTTEVQNTQQADNATPLGRGIPKLIGTGPAKGEIVIDPDLLGGIRIVRERYVVNLVLMFLDTDLGGAADLLWLKANDEFVYRSQAPQRSPSSPIRIYGGDQTAVDPLIEEYLDAEYQTMWPGMAYVVLEDFDITPYSSNGEIPTFTSAWATSATAQANGTTEVTQIDGGIDGTWNLGCLCYDHVRGVVYAISYDSGNTPYLSTIDVNTNTEVRRVNCSSGYVNTYTYFMVALPGSDYVVVTATADGTDSTDSGRMYTVLMDVNTGAVAAALPTYEFGGGSWYEPQMQRAVLYRSDTATKFMLFGEPWGSYGTDSSWAVYVADVDVTAGTMAWICHPATTPIAANMYSTSTSNANPNGMDAVVKDDGSVDLYLVIDEPGTNPTDRREVYKVNITDGGVQSVETLFSSPGATAGTGYQIEAIAYDVVSEAVVISCTDDYLRQVYVADGSTGYAVDFSATYQYCAINRWDMGLFDGVFTSSVMRAGWATAILEPTGSFINQIGYVDLTNGSIYMVDWQNDVGSYFFTFDQNRGEIYTISFDPWVWRYTLGDLTPGVVDATDILTSLATYMGDYDISGDLTFSGFAGGEAYGLVLANDFTIDNEIRGVLETIGAREFHDGGKLNYVMPARDGSFAIDRALSSDDLVMDQIVQTISDEDAAAVQVDLEYFDYDADFNRVTQTYRRPVGVYQTTKSGRIERKATNLVLTAPQAAKQAWRMSVESEYERASFSMKLAPRALDVTPVDFVSFSFGSRTIVGEVREARLNADLTQDISVSQALQVSENAFVGSGLVTVAPTYLNTSASLVMLDTALLSYGDDFGGDGLRTYGVLISSGEADIATSSAWQSSSGYTYSRVASRSGTPVISGTITGAITRNYDDGFQTDYAAELIVQITGGAASSLVDVSEAKRYGNANFAAIGAPGRWVLISWSDVTVSGSLATFTDIIWGVHGTEVYLSSLAVGDRFINLEASQVVRFLSSPTTLDTTLYYKGGYSGAPLASLVTAAVVADGEAEKPYAVVNATYEDVASPANTREISWEFRERLSPIPVLTGAESAGYSEDTLAFEVDLLNGSGTVLTTLQVSTNSASYDTTVYTATSAKIYQMGLGGLLRGHATTLTF